jgi:hypothetical protein
MMVEIEHTRVVKILMRLPDGNISAAHLGYAVIVIMNIGMLFKYHGAWLQRNDMNPH